MFIKKGFFFILFAIYFSIISYSQEEGLNIISQENLQRHLEFIASDSLQGRRFGTEVSGLEIAAQYIKDNIEKERIIPGVDGYYQHVDIRSAKPDSTNTFIKILDGNSQVVFKTNEIISLNRNNSKTDISGEIIFTNFGWRDTVSGYNDFNGLDLNNKIVMFVQGNPETYYDGNVTRWNNRLETSKMKRAFMEGAKAVIVVTSPKDKKGNTYKQISNWMNRERYYLAGDSSEDDSKPFFLTSSNVADIILDDGVRLKKHLKAATGKKEIKLDSDNEFYRAEIQISSIEKKFDGKNIIGLVEGSDPVLKNECVVFMAHYDHLGIGEAGDVYNGADDNGSGTVALLELARAFQLLKLKPRRSVLFLWVTGEEIGLFGSRYYVNHPVFRLEKTVACINIDMIGRVYEPRDSIWKDSPKLVRDEDEAFTLVSNFCPKLQELSDTACKTMNLIPNNSLPQSFIRRSDQYNFHLKGVPILNVATGYHADYHKVSDEVSKINFEKMKQITDYCFLVGYKLANGNK